MKLFDKEETTTVKPTSVESTAVAETSSTTIEHIENGKTFASINDIFEHLKTEANVPEGAEFKIEGLDEVNRILAKTDDSNIEDAVIISEKTRIEIKADEDKEVKLHGSSPEDRAMFEDIAKTFKTPVDLLFKCYFVVAGSTEVKHTYNIDTSVFAPKPTSLIGCGKFEKKYYDQLRHIIGTSGDTVSEDGLRELLYIYNSISTGSYPIQLKSKKFVKLLSKISTVMNSFFNDNRSLIRSIYAMFNSNMDTKREEIEAASKAATEYVTTADVASVITEAKTADEVISETTITPSFRAG